MARRSCRSASRSRQLESLARELALDHVGLAEILADQRVVRVERHGLQVIADAFVDAAELAGCIAAIVQRLGGVRVLQEVERRQRFLVAAVLRQSVGVGR